MIYSKADLSDHLTDTLISLSLQWEQEYSCYGYRSNSLEDFQKEDIFTAQKGDCTVGYLFCHTYIQDKESCTVPKGSKCLEVEELYVRPEYRSKGIGKNLFRAAVSHYGREITYVTLSTATKNYKAIFHFYIEELGMNFWHARLFKKLED